MQIQEMTRDECQAMLAGTRLGRLACVRDQEPYIVPIYFAYSNPYLYGFTGPGQKIEWMRANPQVCVEVDDVMNPRQWVSVVVFGRFEELPDTPEWGSERFCAHGLLQSQAGWWQPGAARSTQRDSAQPFAPIFYRIMIDRMTGRRASLDAQERASSHAT
jgi:hypothetical protein